MLMYFPVPALQDLQPKDWITLIASLSAFTFSALSYWQRSGDSKIGIRKQLTDTIQRLTDINTSVAKYHALSKAKRDLEFPPNYVRLLNDQRRFLVRQAEFLSRRIRPLVSPFECLLIASAFDEIDDTIRAEEFFRRACDAADAIDRGIALRGHGQYLLARGRTDEGNGKFEASLQSFAGDSDHLRIYRAQTCERWAVQARGYGDDAVCERLLMRAVAEYAKLDHASRRDHEVDRVEKRLARVRAREGYDIASEDEQIST